MKKIKEQLGPIKGSIKKIFLKIRKILLVIFFGLITTYMTNKITDWTPTIEKYILNIISYIVDIIKTYWAYGVLGFIIISLIVRIIILLTKLHRKSKMIKSLSLYHTSINKEIYEVYYLSLSFVSEYTLNEEGTGLKQTVTGTRKMVVQKQGLKHIEISYEEIDAPEKEEKSDVKIRKQPSGHTIEIKESDDSRKKGTYDLYFVPSLNKGEIVEFVYEQKIHNVSCSTREILKKKPHNRGYEFDGAAVVAPVLEFEYTIKFDRSCGVNINTVEPFLESPAYLLNQVDVNTIPLPDIERKAATGDTRWSTASYRLKNPIPGIRYCLKRFPPKDKKELEDRQKG